MTAWELLTENSTLTSGTAWGHISSQAGVLVYGEMQAELMAELSAEIEQEIGADVEGGDLAAELEQEIGSEIE